MGDKYITNPSAQQGEPMYRKGSVRPANIEANSELPTPAEEDRLKEAPVEIPDHLGQPAKPTKTKRESTRDTSPKSMGEKIGR
jgi:hypothetical protein